MTPDLHAHRWSTAAFGHTETASPLDVSTLGEHLHLCQRGDGRLLRLRCAAETAHGFVAARFVTTLLVAALLMAVVSLLV